MIKKLLLSLIAIAITIIITATINPQPTYATMTCYDIETGQELTTTEMVMACIDSDDGVCRVTEDLLAYPPDKWGDKMREIRKEKIKKAREFCKNLENSYNSSSSSSGTSNSSNDTSGSSNGTSGSSNGSTLPITTPINSSTGLTGQITNPVFDGRGRGDQDPCPSFLGLTSWDCGVSISDQDSLKAGIWAIAANILTDIIVIAAYLVLGYVIYGGYRYTFSAGEPSKVAEAKKTLAHAFIGLAIVMSATTILSSIRIALVGDSGNISNCIDGCVNPSDMVTNLIQWVIGIAGIVSAVFVVYGGIAYTTSSGDAAKLQKAKNMIVYALIGLAIVALAEVITAFVSNMIREANKNAYINETIISKEVYEIKLN